MVTESYATVFAPADRTAPDNTRRDLSPFGGKGAALCRLVDHGQPVPRTGVVRTNAYRTVIDTNPLLQRLIARIDGGETVAEPEVDETFAAALVPTEMATELAVMASEVGGCGGRAAFRSSATVEDLSGSSFAGQYRSFLNVDTTNPTAVIDAIRAVWASLWYPAPASYRRAFGIETGDVAMAVVVMEMIDATTAGVVFTADPGGSMGARVEAVEGLGESLVSGERTPEAWVVPHASPTDPDPAAPDPADPDPADGVVDAQAGSPMPAAARRALQLARRIEHDFGVPQDVEWAAVGDEVYVVQARPITVLDEDDGFDTALDEHELTSAGIAELVPGVVPPLLWEVNAFLLEHAFRSVLDSLGVIRGEDAESRPFIRRVRGRLAVDFDQLRAAASGVPGAVAQLETQYFGEPVTANDATEATEATEAAETRGAGRGPRSWLHDLRRDLRTARTRRWVIDHAEVLVDAVAQLRTRQPDLANLTNEALLAYQRRLLDLASRGLIGELGVAAAGGASFDRLLMLLEKYLGEGEGPGAVQRVIAHAGTAIARIPESSASLFGGATWTELDLEPPVHTADSKAAAQADLDELEDRIAALPGWRRRRIMTGQFVDVRLHVVRRTIADVREQLHRREASKAAFLELGGEFRRVQLELGRRLVQRGVLQNPVDANLLSTAELWGVLEGSADVTTDVIKRRANWLTRYDAEGQLPMRFRGVPDRTRKPLPQGDRLAGWAASPGRYHGLAQVISNADDELPIGAILVAEATDASWSPLFLRAGAIVVERGGPLSHAAILARELGLPAVLNVEDATRVLHGCTVSVDGDEGIVVIEHREEAATGPTVHVSAQPS